MKKKAKKIVLIRIAIVLLAVLFGVSLWQLLSAGRNYAQEKQAHEALLIYKPELPPVGGPTVPTRSGSTGPSGHSDPVRPGEPQQPDETQDPDVTPETVNESILQLQADYPNSVGWITVPGTNVDYPFAQAKDNNYYLRRGLDGKYLYAGVPFLDYRCAPDFSSDNTVIYGHNLRNGTMFGSLEKFRQRAFFEENREFYIFLPHDTLRVEIFACLVISPSKGEYLYQTVINGGFTEQIRQDARQFRALPARETERFVTLSTCGYEFSGARIVLVGRIVE